jgi:hypothetical protein
VSSARWRRGSRRPTRARTVARTLRHVVIARWGRGVKGKRPGRASLKTPSRTSVLRPSCSSSSRGNSSPMDSYGEGRVLRQSPRSRRELTYPRGGYRRVVGARPCRGEPKWLRKKVNPEGVRLRVAFCKSNSRFEPAKLVADELPGVLPSRWLGNGDERAPVFQLRTYPQGKF